MCGIWGKWNFDPSQIISDQAVRDSCRLMAHRGPDGEGVWCQGNVALGHRRLSIIDLATGDQPMSYGDGRFWITYNGEIYNYLTLKNELLALGYTFQTTSDTELVLAAYAHWGVDCVKRFNGIFAFGIWDRETHELFIARDHLGIKPLLYHYSERGITFSSELKPLIHDPLIAQTGLSRQAIADYLALGYVLSPNTIVEGVKRLPPAHYMKVTSAGLQIQSYWNMADFVTAPSLADSPDFPTEYLNDLQTAVERQMIADVPVGAFLSGGVDSSSIVALMSQKHSIQTFSMGFQEQSYSELDYAGLVANHYQTQHHSELVNPQHLDQELARMMWIYDEPLGDSSLIPTYFVAQLAAKSVKVVLSGDGADESLAGYDTYIADQLLRGYRYIPSIFHQFLIRPVLSAFPQSAGKVSLHYRLDQFTRYARQSPEVAHYHWRELFDSDERLSLLGHQKDLVSQTPEHFISHYEQVKSAHPLNQALYVDMQTWLLDDILPKVDRASMAASLEARVPFLDVWLLEKVLRLPPEWKMQGFKRKVILRQAMQDRLPSEILKRSKRGFNAPTAIWMSGILREQVTGLLEAGSNMLDTHSPHLNRIWEEYLGGRANHSYKLWNLISLLLWEQHVWNKITKEQIVEHTN